MSSNRIVFTLLILVLAISSCLRADDLDEYMGMFSKRGKILEIDINELSEFAFAEHVQCIDRLVDIVDSIKGDLIVISTYDQDDPLYDYIFFKLAQEDVFAKMFGAHISGSGELRPCLFGYDSLYDISEDSTEIFKSDRFRDIYPGI